jgi:sugar lactone lactonase YvrE
MAPDGSGLYFANQYMVGRVAPDGTMDFVAGSRKPPLPPGNPTGLREPVGLAFAPDGTLYIADLVGNEIWKRTSDGTLTVFAGNGQGDFGGDGGPASAAELDRPRAVAVERDGDVLIADTGNDRIREVIHGSNVIETVAGSGDYYGFSGDGGPATQAKLSLPWGIAVTSSGTIYIADAGNDRIRAINARSIITTVVHADLNAPAGLAVSASGDLYVVDLGDYWLRRVHLA